MKLLTKTSRYYATVLLLIFLAGGILFFLTVRSFINNDIVEKLNADRVLIENRIKDLDSIPNTFFAINGDLLIKKVDAGNVNIKPLLKDTILYDKKERDEEIPARAIIFLAKSRLYTYQLTLTISLVESDDIIEAISLALLVLIVLFLLSLYFINIRISKIIWNPFYQSLDKIKKYDLDTAIKLQVADSDIDEFNELNSAVELMTDKIQADYKNLKEFTEDASHEIQTPLAIIKTKLELLIQSEDLNEEQMLLIQSINDATNRLSRLNQSLLLLAKIENHQYQQKESVNLGDLVQKYLANYKELIEAKGLSLKTTIAPGCFVKTNPLLADVLITNLIGNAIKHNTPEGQIVIELSPTDLIISNTGSSLKQDPLLLFERFKKDRSDSESLGLGLSIVKKICDSEHIQINYTFSPPIHQIRLTF